MVEIRLSEAPRGYRVIVKTLAGGQGGELRAVAMGLAPGTVLEVLSNERGLLGYPVVVRLSGRVIAVSRRIAEEVEVELLEDALEYEREKEYAEGRV